MKALPLATLALSILFLSSCGAPENSTPAATQEQPDGATSPDTAAVRDHDGDEVVAYACPMHPEVTGKQGDTCSKCGMDLEKVD